VWEMGGSRDAFSASGANDYPLNVARVKGVGGSTNHWQGMVMRLHEADFDGANNGPAWPVSYEELRPYYQAAERALGVPGASDNPYAPPRDEPHPLSAFPPSYSDALFANACERVGIDTHSVPNARNSEPYDDRSACVGYGTCKPVCPSGAKYSADHTMRQAEAKGAELLTDAPVQRLETDAAGEPTGVLVEAAIDPIYEAVEPDLTGTKAAIEAGLELCRTRGITGFHDMVRDSHAPRVYRELERAGDLTARVRINYWLDHFDALCEAGLTTNAGSSLVETGALKSYTDGSFGGRTAKLSTPYADTPDETGQWVVDPASLATAVADVTAAGYQFAAHAIGDDAIDAVLTAYEEHSVTDPADARHRIEHVELADDAAIDRLAATGAVASVQPNFLKWAGADGLYETRLGAERTAATNRYRDLLDAGVPLAFGSDGMPMDPLYGIHHAVNAPAARQRLTVTEAVRAYTHGAAYAGFDEDRLGTVEVGTCADFVVLDASPWEHPASIRDIAVLMTVVDGTIVYDGR